MNVNVEEVYLTMVTFNQVCICRTKEELLNALTFRHYPFCEVAVLSNFEEAQWYVQQRYHTNFFANPHLYGHFPMPLPNLCNETGYNIRTNDFAEINTVADVYSESNTGENRISAYNSLSNIALEYAKPFLQSKVNEGLFWSIDAINGFAVASNLNEMIYFLLESELIYSHAIPYMHDYLASINSRTAYLNRIARRYGFGAPIELPANLLRCGEIFVDINYDEKEKQRKNNEIRNNLMFLGLV